jgi:hypothetical protein
MANAGLDGAWGGMQDGVCAQVIVVGATVIGFFWRDEYLAVTDAQFSIDGRSLSFKFKGGKARLSCERESAASLEVSEGGKILILNLQRD